MPFLRPRTSYAMVARWYAAMASAIMSWAVSLCWPRRPRSWTQAQLAPKGSESLTDSSDSLRGLTARQSRPPCMHMVSSLSSGFRRSSATTIMWRILVLAKRSWRRRGQAIVECQSGHLSAPLPHSWPASLGNEAPQWLRDVEAVDELARGADRLTVRSLGRRSSSARSWTLHPFPTLWTATALRFLAEMPPTDAVAPSKRLWYKMRRSEDKDATQLAQAVLQSSNALRNASGNIQASLKSARLCFSVASTALTLSCLSGACTLPLRRRRRSEHGADWQQRVINELSAICCH